MKKEELVSILKIRAIHDIDEDDKQYSNMILDFVSIFFDKKITPNVSESYAFEIDFESRKCRLREYFNILESYNI